MLLLPGCGGITIRGRAIQNPAAVRCVRNLAQSTDLVRWSVARRTKVTEFSEGSDGKLGVRLNAHTATPRAKPLE